MKTKNKLAFIGIFLLAVILISASVSAFGVSSPYWEGNPLQMSKGETKTVYLNLQNMVGDEDVTVKAKVIEGSEIVSIKEDTFVIKAKTSDTLVPVKITLPNDAEVGSIEKVKIEFKTISKDKGGISMGTGMIVAFDVVTAEKIKNNTDKIILIIAAALILAGLLVILNKKRKNK